MKTKILSTQKPYLTNNIDIDKIVVSDKVSLGKKVAKHFIGYKDGKKVRPLCILLPNIGAYRRNFDETIYVSFLTKDDEALEKIIKFGKMSAIASKKDLIVSL